MCSEKSTDAVYNANEFAHLLGAGVLGHGLGALADGVLGELSGKEKTNSGLDFAAGDGRPAVVVSKTRCLGGDALEDVVDERVHDAHGLAGDTGVGVDLLQHFVNVDAVAFPPPLPSLLVPGTLGLGLAGRLLGSLRCWFRWHYRRSEESVRMCFSQQQQLCLRTDRRSPPTGSALRHP